MSKAAELAALIGSQTALSNRNLIINGAMQVSQRGTSFTDADTYALDRWRLNQSSETMAVTQQSFAAGQTDVPRAEKYLRVVVTTTGNFAGITQRIEGVEQLSGQTVTVSFYARGGQGGQGVPTTFRTYLNQNFGSGGSTAVNVQGSTNHTLTTSWKLFTATVTLGSTSGQTIGTSPYTELAFQQTTGEACDFDIALVQLELGEQATPFEHRLFADELQRCQRYFFAQQAIDGEDYYAFGFGAAEAAGTFRGLSSFPVTMRVEPSLTATASDTFFTQNFTPASNTASLDQSGRDCAYVTIFGSGGTAGYAGRWMADNTDAAYLFWSAEL